MSCVSVLKKKSKLVEGAKRKTILDSLAVSKEEKG